MHEGPDDPGEVRHVLLPPGERFDVATLARDLSALLEDHPLDLAQHLRYGGGWVARGITASVAEKIRSVLGRHQVRHLVLRGPLADEPRVQTVRTVTFDGATLELIVAGGPESIPLDRVAIADLVAIGDPDAGHADGDELSRQARLLAGAIRGFPFDVQRLALLSGTLDPIFHVIRNDPVAVYRVERGTLFPHYAEVMGGVWLDNLMAFLHHLLPALSPRRVFPSTRAFWFSPPSGDREGDGNSTGGRSGGPGFRGIVIEKDEELGNRLRWQHEVVVRNLWEDLA